MIVYRSLAAAEADRARWARPAAAVGFFDGLHLGHRKLLEDLKGWAAESGGAPLLITFERHPQETLSGSAPPAVHSLRHRLLLLEREGIAAVLVLRFDRDLSLWSPEEFVERALVRALGARRLLLGFDSAIGHRRLGTHEYLAARAAGLGIEVRQSGPFILAGERISSTLVRQAVVQGDLERLVRITGRPHAILGEVIAGDGRGRSIGFPTANLRIEAEAVLPGGVYFARADRIDADPSRAGAGGPSIRSHPALINIGRRPTFTGAPAASAAGGELPRFQPDIDRIEAHLLDFDGNLYGDLLEISFLRRQRPERRFDGAPELAAQIRRDVEAFRNWLERD